MPNSHCAECRTSVEIGDDYAHGAQLRCPSCQTPLRVIRRGGAGPRLVHSEIEPLRDALAVGQRQQRQLEADLAKARASLGIGVNGIGLGVLYVVAKVALEELPLTRELIVNAALIAVTTGIGLELANLLFLAKRRQMAQLGDEIDDVEQSNRDLKRKLRDAMRS